MFLRNIARMYSKYLFVVWLRVKGYHRQLWTGASRRFRVYIFIVSRSQGTLNENPSIR